MLPAVVQRHWPFMHWRPPPVLHTTPQPPQLALSVSGFVHRGPDALGHTRLPAAGQPQAPFWQVWPLASQSLPQVPQLLMLLLRTTSHPLVGSLSQFARPGKQTRMHCPISQVPVCAPGSPTQELPHDPQFIGSLLVLMQRAAAPVPQANWPAGQAQVPIVQLWPVAQAFPHMPQLASEVCRLAQVIIVPVPQAVWPIVVSQLTRHVPIEQT